MLTVLKVAFQEEEIHPEGNVEIWNQQFDEFNVISGIARGFKQILSHQATEVQVEYMELALEVFIKWHQLRPYKMYQTAQNGRLHNYVVPSCLVHCDESQKICKNLSTLLVPYIMGKEVGFYHILPRDWILRVVNAFCNAFCEDWIDNRVLCDNFVDAVTGCTITSHATQVKEQFETVFP